MLMASRATGDWDSPFALTFNANAGEASMSVAG
jgi:hypothetical protein